MNRRIETERLILRPLTIDDASDVFEWVSDPVVNRFLPYALYENVSQVKAWISSITEEKNEFAFSLKETGKVIGSGSVKFNKEENAYEIGYNFNRKFWGKGYGTEGAMALIDWAYNELGARDFFAGHAIKNVASGNVIKKCGFAFVRFGEYSRYDDSETFESAFYVMHKD